MEASSRAGAPPEQHACSKTDGQPWVATATATPVLTDNAPLDVTAPSTPLLLSPARCLGSTSSSSSSSSSSVDGAAAPLLATAAAADTPALPHVQACAVAASLDGASLKGKTILIISGGTRGDVQPACVLGAGLARAGARVRLAADPAFRALAQSAGGLEFYPLGGCARDMMSLTVKWGGMLPTELAGIWWLRQQIGEVMESVWAAATDATPPPPPVWASTSGAAGGRVEDAAAPSSPQRAPPPPPAAAAAAAAAPGPAPPGAVSAPPAAAAFKPDIVLSNQLAYGQVHVAEKLGVPLHVILTIPWLPTAQIAHPWARAFDRNIVEWADACARTVLRPLLAAVGMCSSGSVASRWLQDAVLGRVTAAANRLSTLLLDSTAWWGIADLIARFRCRLGLPLLSRNSTGTALYRYPTTLLYSQLLVPRPADWGPHVTVAGFLWPHWCQLEPPGPNGDATSTSASATINANGSTSSSSSAAGGDAASASSTAASGTGTPTLTSSSGSLWLQDYMPPQDLADFLAAGPPPLYVGFGSMTLEDPRQLMRLLLKAVRQLQDSCSARVRVLVCTGWAGEGLATASGGGKQQQPPAGGSHRDDDGAAVPHGRCLGGSSSSSSDPDVFMVAEAPHDWLFPRCCVLVHHGGVGTTAAGLRHGKPTLVVPAFGDLFFWGDICHTLGVGPAPLPLKGLTAAQLAEAMQQLLADPGYRAAAEAVAARLKAEHGLDAAVASVHATLCAAGRGQ